MIVCLSGRMYCGKSTLAEELIKKGFVKFSFADYLKKSVSKLYGWKIADLSDPAKKQEKLKTPVFWNKINRLKLEKIIGEKLSVIDINVSFYSIREALQYIGTEVLRNHDPDFHVKKTLNDLNTDVNCVCDDLRFMNEKKAIELLGGICLYIIRPTNLLYSNHISEVSLNREDFKHVIVNACKKKTFIKKFNKFIESIYENSTINF